jgi:uncharacterized protein (TIGR01777 family)
MKILVTGATGFIGRSLVGRLAGAGHEVVPLQRGESSTDGAWWRPDDGVISDGAMSGVDAIVHLAGESIGGRWTTSKKQEIMSSRTEGTTLIARAAADAGIETLVSGSAIGFYGDRGDEILTEDAGPGTGFLSDVVVGWEASTQPAVDAGVRTVMIRTALVLEDSGGSFPRMLLPFKLGIGGPLGGGDQWWGWIALADEVRAIVHCLENHDIAGPVNLAAPNPARNVDFSKELGKALHRPAFLPAPDLAIKTLLGAEFAEQVLFASQRVVPTKLMESGFEFEYPTLPEAFSAIL